MKWKQVLSLALLITSVVFTALALRPIRDVSLEDTDSITGSVRAVLADSSTGDMVIYLHENNVMYSINRGHFSGLDAHQIRKALLNKPVAIYYVRHWTPLDPLSQHRHVARIALNNRVVYDEISK